MAQRLKEVKEGDFYERLGRWFLADPAERRGIPILMIQDKHVMKEFCSKPPRPVHLAGKVHMFVLGLLCMAGSAHAQGIAPKQSAMGDTAQWSLNNTNLFYNAGSVGIGTMRPAKDVRLEVNGPVRVTAIGSGGFLQIGAPNGETGLGRGRG